MIFTFVSHLSLWSHTCLPLPLDSGCARMIVHWSPLVSACLPPVSHYTLDTSHPYHSHKYPLFKIIHTQYMLNNSISPQTNITQTHSAYPIHAPHLKHIIPHSNDSLNTFNSSHASLSHTHIKSHNVILIQLNRPLSFSPVAHSRPA